MSRSQGKISTDFGPKDLFSYVLVSDWFINNGIKWCLGEKTDGTNSMRDVTFANVFSQEWVKFSKHEFPTKLISSFSIVL